MKLLSFCPDLKSDIKQQILDAIRSPAEIILFPEYLLELTDFEPFPVPDKFIVFGSKVSNNQNILFVSNGGEIHRQPKIKLTPWETDLDAGSEIKVYTFGKIKIAVLVCFDVEFPEISTELRSQQVDLLLVPSATGAVLGYERVNRCASARAVELGCAVATCHLVGETEHALVDVNVGANNLFLPSQQLFENFSRQQLASLRTSGESRDTFSLPLTEIAKQRLLRGESNPSLND